MGQVVRRVRAKSSVTSETRYVVDVTEDGQVIWTDRDLSASDAKRAAAKYWDGLQAHRVAEVAALRPPAMVTGVARIAITRGRIRE